MIRCIIAALTTDFTDSVVIGNTNTLIFSLGPLLKSSTTDATVIEVVQSSLTYTLFCIFHVSAVSWTAQTFTFEFNIRLFANASVENVASSVLPTFFDTEVV